MSLFTFQLDREYGAIQLDVYRFGGALLLYHLIATLLGGASGPLGAPLFGPAFLEVAVCLLLTILAYHLVYARLLAPDL